MKHLHKLTIIFIFCCIQIISAQIKEVNYKKDATFQIEKWEVLDVVFQAKTTIKSPYTANFYATFIHESGQKQEVPGFYNGNSDWILRCSSSL